MNDSAFWISTYWNPVWGIIIYVFRGLHDLFVGRARVSKEIKIQKLKAIGQDFYWIAVVIWGILLVKSDPKNILVSYIGTEFHFRLLIIVCIASMAVIISWLRAKEENLSKNAIATRRQVIKAWALNLAIHIIGTANLLFALSLMGRVK